MTREKFTRVNQIATIICILSVFIMAFGIVDRSFYSFIAGSLVMKAYLFLSLVFGLFFIRHG